MARPRKNPVTPDKVQNLEDLLGGEPVTAEQLPEESAAQEGAVENPPPEQITSEPNQRTEAEIQVALAGLPEIDLPQEPAEPEPVVETPVDLDGWSPIDTVARNGFPVKITDDIA